MSILVHHDGTLASDSHANSGDKAFSFPKLWTTPDGALAGAVGPLQAVTQLQLWTNDGCEAASFPLSYLVNTNAQLLILTKDKGLLRYKDSATPYLHGWNSYAVGEGAPFAYGAMFMGATAEQAVLAAIDGSPYCNGQVVSMRLEWLYL